jgi:hypothetical protein
MGGAAAYEAVCDELALACWINVPAPHPKVELPVSGTNTVYCRGRVGLRWMRRGCCRQNARIGTTRAIMWSSTGSVGQPHSGNSAMTSTSTTSSGRYRRCTDTHVAAGKSVP